MIDTFSVERSFLPRDLEVSNWEQVEKFFNDLLGRDLANKSDLLKWLRDRSELEAFLTEDFGWRYIRMSCDTANEDLSKAFNFFVTEIQPRIAPLSHQLDKQLLASAAVNELSERSYFILLRQVKKRVEIFREENIPLISDLQQQEQEFSAITGAMTIEMNGQEITLQQAGNYLEQTDRALRESVFFKVNNRRLLDKDKLNDLLHSLIEKRSKVAANAGFSSYREYMFASLGRFDYSVEDCLQFHQSVEKLLVPLNNQVDERHRNDLGLKELRPWDSAASKPGQSPLKPCESGSDLMEKTIACFEEIDPFLGECMRAMRDANRLDLESRKGKAPGGYNYPLYETGLPFIFMNSSNTLRDLVTMVHEGGHAVQSIVDIPLELVDFKNIPSEVAELASMSMELISMEHWQHFFSNPDELKRARRKHLEDVLKGLPWIACVDAFQHWLYTHPGHTSAQRNEAWVNCHQRFSGNTVDWSGLDDFRENIWQKQLHIYEVPFYYIEYGFAQLGAIAMWKNYQQDPSGTIRKYIDALKMGYTASIGEIYERAGIRFDFSEDYVRELSDFVRDEWKKLL